MNEHWAKEYLQKIKWCDIERDRIIQEMKQEQARAFSISSIRYDKERVISGGKNVTEEKIIKYVHTIEVLDDQYKKIEEERLEIISKINRINDARMREVLKLKYISNMTLEKISETIYQSLPCVKMVHKKALDEFERISSYT